MTDNRAASRAPHPVPGRPEWLCPGALDAVLSGRCDEGIAHCVDRRTIQYCEGEVWQEPEACPPDIVGSGGIQVEIVTYCSEADADLGASGVAPRAAPPRRHTRRSAGPLWGQPELLHDEADYIAQGTLLRAAVLGNASLLEALGRLALHNPAYAGFVALLEALTGIGAPLARVLQCARREFSADCSCAAGSSRGLEGLQQTSPPGFSGCTPPFFFSA